MRNARLAGDANQAYACELAERGFITIAPDAVGFEERTWSPDRSENISWSAAQDSNQLVRAWPTAPKPPSIIGAVR